MALVYYHLKPGSSTAAVQWTGFNGTAIQELLGHNQFFSDDDSNLVYKDNLSNPAQVRTVAVGGWVVAKTEGFIPMSDAYFSGNYDPD